jgi:peptide/nickel transport system ATP-binding protein
MTAPVLEVERLTVALPRGADRPEALSEVSFAVARGQLLCLVGESGSGKSIAAHTVMGLLPGNVRAAAGRVTFGGEDLLLASSPRLRRLRGEKMSMIFQEPMTALNPVMTCGAQIDELLVQHTALPAADRRKRVLAMLERVRLPESERIYASYPHQLS